VPSSSAAVVVRHHHCHCLLTPLSPSAFTVVVVCRRRHPPPPSYASTAIIATPCLRRLLAPALIRPLCSPLPNLACHCCPPLLLSAFAIVIRRRRLPLPQPSSPLRCLCHLSPPTLVLPHCTPPPNQAYCCRPPPPSSATVIIRRCRTSTHPC
jgi:hypothetical protein